MNEIYLITGAMSDIAIQFIQILGKTSKEIMIIAIDKNEFDKKQFAVYENIQVKSFCCDLSKADEIRYITAQLKEQSLVPTHILHFAALKYEYASAKEFDYERTSLDFSIQVLSIMELCKSILPAMKKQKYGKIVFMISSVTEGVPPKKVCQYATVKYALLGLMRSLASEYQQKNIGICGFSPDMVKTKFLSEIDPRVVELNAMSGALVLEPEEAARKISDILQKSCDEINGKNYSVGTIEKNE